MRKHSGEQEENSARVRNEGHLTHAISDTVSSRLYNACSMLSSSFVTLTFTVVFGDSLEPRHGLRAVIVAAVRDDGDEAAEARVADPVRLLVGRRVDQRERAHHSALPLRTSPAAVLFHPLRDIFFFGQMREMRNAWEPKLISQPASRHEVTTSLLF